MGYGQFVGNGSVHWRVDHEAGRDMDMDASDDAPTQYHRVHVKRRIQGSDPTRGDAFSVTLRFDSREQAEQAFKDALAGLNGAKDPKNVYVTVQVPALRRPNATAAPDPEVRVRW